MDNTATVSIRLATANDHRTVGDMVCRLLCELVPDNYDMSDAAKFSETAEKLLAPDNGFWVALAFQKNNDGSERPVGMMSLDEGHALYAHGSLGEIMELYVDPSQRSSGLGARLIDFAVAFGREQGWSMIEVGAPDLPRWQRTVDFYLRYGFKEIGPRLEYDL